MAETLAIAVVMLVLLCLLLAFFCKEAVSDFVKSRQDATDARDDYIDLRETFNELNFTYEQLIQENVSRGIGYIKDNGEYVFFLEKL